MEQAKQDIDNAQNKSSSDFDAEISAINDKRKSVDKSPDFAALGSNTMVRYFQILKFGLSVFSLIL